MKELKQLPDDAEVFFVVDKNVNDEMIATLATKVNNDMKICSVSEKSCKQLVENIHSKYPSVVIKQGNNISKCSIMGNGKNTYALCFIGDSSININLEKK